MKQWTASDISKGKSLAPIEFETDDGLKYFELILTQDRSVFGGCCNVGFLESGYIPRNEDEDEYLDEPLAALDETLASLIEDLEVYYNQGRNKGWCSRIVCNERM